jgi:hypothetical protein
MGDALFHIAWTEEYVQARPPKDVARDPSDPLMDEDEII